MRGRQLGFDALVRSSLASWWNWRSSWRIANIYMYSLRYFHSENEWPTLLAVP